MKYKNGMKTIKLCHAIKYAEDKYMLAGSALQQIPRYLKFKGFGDEEPLISIASINEIILVYEDCELSTTEMIDCMETKGCIEPTDFGVQSVK